MTKPATRKRRAPKVWPLEELLRADRNAGTAYLAIHAFAGESRRYVCSFAPYPPARGAH